jgi:hypothetical protein
MALVELVGLEVSEAEGKGSDKKTKGAAKKKAAKKAS